MVIFKTPEQGWIAVDRIIRINPIHTSDSPHAFTASVWVEMAWAEKRFEMHLAVGFWPDETRDDIKKHKALCYKQAEEVLQSLLKAWEAVKDSRI